ncbi:MAG: hypothetical protein ACRCR5_05300, partial [Lactococcus garvieae]
MSKDNNVDYYSSKEKSHEVVKNSVHVKESPISKDKYQDKASAISNKKDVLKKGSKENSRAKKISKTDNKSSKSIENIKKNKLKSSEKNSDQESSTAANSKKKKKKSDSDKKPHQRFFHNMSKKELLKKQSLNRTNKKAMTSLSGSKGELGEVNEQTEWTDKGNDAAHKAKTIIKQGKKILDNRNENLIDSFGQSFKKNFRKEKFFSNTKSTQSVTVKKSTSSGINLAKGGTKAVSKWNVTYFKELLRQAFSPKVLAIKFSVVGGWVGLAVILIMMLIFFIGGL